MSAPVTHESRLQCSEQSIIGDFCTAAVAPVGERQPLKTVQRTVAHHVAVLARLQTWVCAILRLLRCQRALSAPTLAGGPEDIEISPPALVAASFPSCFDGDGTPLAAATLKLVGSWRVCTREVRPVQYSTSRSWYSTVLSSRT